MAEPQAPGPIQRQNKYLTINISAATASNSASLCASKLKDGISLQVPAAAAVTHLKAHTHTLFYFPIRPALRSDSFTL